MISVTIPITVMSMCVGIIPESTFLPVKMPTQNITKAVTSACKSQTALVMAVAWAAEYPFFFIICMFTKAGPTPAGMETAVNPEAACDVNRTPAEGRESSIKDPTVIAEPTQASKLNAKHNRTINVSARLRADTISWGCHCVAIAARAATIRISVTKNLILKRANRTVS